MDTLCEDLVCFILLTATKIAQQYKDELISMTTLNIPLILLQKLYQHNSSNDMCIKESKTLNVLRCHIHTLLILLFLHTSIINVYHNRDFHLTKLTLS